MASQTNFTKTQFSLNLAAADAISNGAIAAVTNLSNPHKAVCVTVLDSAGGILVQKRMDGCPDGAYRKFSYAKARTCVHLQTSSRQFRTKYTGSSSDSNGEVLLAEPQKFTQAASMVSVMEGELIPVAGGILVQNTDGYTVGAVGVSGAAADEDEYLALEGVKALGDGSLETIPQGHSCSTLISSL